MMAAGD